MVFQSGDVNVSTAVQSGFANESGDIGSLAAGVKQSGAFNESTITQSGQLSSALVDQMGDYGFASITQSVNNAPNPAGGPDPLVSTASIEQAGSDHSSTIVQFGGNDTQSARLMDATSVQSGTGNNSFISQTNSLIDATASGNVALSTQMGDYGLSTIIQDGVGHSATLSQGGSYNTSTINQTAVSNSATVTQN